MKLCGTVFVVVVAAAALATPSAAEDKLAEKTGDALRAVGSTTSDGAKALGKGAKKTGDGAVDVTAYGAGTAVEATAIGLKGAKDGTTAGGKAVGKGASSFWKGLKGLFGG